MKFESLDPTESLNPVVVVPVLESFNQEAVTINRVCEDHASPSTSNSCDEGERKAWAKDVQWW
jgi:hypothetical protein